MKKIYWMILASTQMIPLYAHAQTTAPQNNSAPAVANQAVPTAEEARPRRDQSEGALIDPTLHEMLMSMLDDARLGEVKLPPADTYVDAKLASTKSANNPPLKISIKKDRPLDDVEIFCDRFVYPEEAQELAARYPKQKRIILTPGVNKNLISATIYYEDETQRRHLLSIADQDRILRISQYNHYNKANPYGDSGSPMISEAPFESLRKDSYFARIEVPSESIYSTLLKRRELRAAKSKPVTDETVIQSGQDQIQNGHSAFEPTTAVTGSN